jgi:hypothetical protein
MMATRKSPAKTAGKVTTAAARKRSEAPASPKQRKAQAAALSPAPTASVPPAARKRVSRKPPTSMNAEERYRAIAHAAYLRAERRGFAPGHEVEDWLAAEAEFDATNRPASD